MTEDRFLRFQPLYLKLKLPDDIFNKLKLSIELEENKKIPYNTNLAGNLKNEFELINVDKEVIKYLEEKSIDFLNSHQFLIDILKPYEIPNKIDAKLSSIWINKQKKYEFNPIHHHGSNISFVTWLQIPYDIEKEFSLDNCKNSNTPRNSNFEFVYPTLGGEIKGEKLHIDKSWEGYIIFFNSKLHHQVYPFYTSDDYRISISGNLDIVDNNHRKKCFNYH